MMSTNTHMPPPACENCGRDKSPTYICAACCDKLNAATRAITAERDEWKRRLDVVVKYLEPKQGPPNPTNPTAVDVAIWRESRSIHRRIVAIAEGRDNG